ncbi:MAG: hypothetical protein HQL09_01645 [Nitrospirae bacterium]|nr:hypothetical protein [Nitrospirota bacterium]
MEKFCDSDLYISIFIVGIVLTAFAAVALFINLPHTKGTRWELYEASDKAAVYYDTRSIRPLSSNRKLVRIKVVYTPDGVRDNVAKMGETYAGIKETRKLYEVNCKERKVSLQGTASNAEIEIPTIQVRGEDLFKSICD